MSDLSIYSRLQKSITSLSKSLNFRRTYKEEKIIPDKYRPTELTISQPNNGLLQRKFRDNYRNIFLQHLDKVISMIQISLETKKAKSINISEIEKLIYSLEDPEQAQEAYEYLTSHTELKDHISFIRLHWIQQQKSQKKPANPITSDNQLNKPNEALEKITSSADRSNNDPKSTTTTDHKHHQCNTNNKSLKRKPETQTTPDTVPPKRPNNHFLSKGLTTKPKIT